MVKNNSVNQNNDLQRDAAWHPHLDQELQLGCAALVQRRHVLTDQRAEVETQLQDLVQAVEHLVAERRDASSGSVGVGGRGGHRVGTATQPVPVLAG